MFSSVSGDKGHDLLARRKHLIRMVLGLSLVVATASLTQAQATPDQPPANPNQQDAPPEAGYGPVGPSCSPCRAQTDEKARPTRIERTTVGE